MKIDEYMRLLAIYFSSLFQDFEKFLRTEIDLVEDDIRLVLDKYSSNFISCDLEPGLYIFKDISEALLRILQAENETYHNAMHIEFDDISMKTKLVGRPSVLAIRFDEKLFFRTILGFIPQWDYKNHNEFISQKVINLNTKSEIHLKCDVVDGSVVKGLTQPIL